MGHKSKYFIGTKAGLVVMEHAMKVLADLYLREDNVGVIPQRMIEAATRCVTADDYAQEYHIDEPFSKDLLFVDPAEAKYVFDNTAIKNCQPKSVFRIRRDDVNFTEANVALGVVSNALLTNNVDMAMVLFSENKNYKPVFKGMSNIFKKIICPKSQGRWITIRPEAARTQASRVEIRPYNLQLTT